MIQEVSSVNISKVLCGRRSDADLMVDANLMVVLQFICAAVLHLGDIKSDKLLTVIKSN